MSAVSKDDKKEKGKELANICQLIEYFNLPLGYGTAIDSIACEKKHAPKLSERSASLVDILATTINTGGTANSIVEQATLLVYELSKKEEEALYAHSLGVSVSKWVHFPSISQLNKFHLYMETARAAKKFFCSEEMIDIGAGHDLVKKSFIDASKVVGEQTQLALVELRAFEIEVAVANNRKEEEKKRIAEEREIFVKQLSEWNKILGVKEKNKDDNDGGACTTKRRKKDQHYE